jgi:2-polyprenyl-6-methoxyphenol hydroxylase-like FAD-dependent oxidoreductase
VRVLIVGGGIGGLTTALALHARGIEDVTVIESSRDIRELGVGINTLPHAIRALRDLGLLEALDAVAIRTAELFYLNRQGQQIWHEPRGLDAGHEVPQLSIHRGMLQAVIAEAVRDRLGAEAVLTGHRLTAVDGRDDGVTAHITRRATEDEVAMPADVLIGADGIHSTVRAALYPAEGPPRWNGSTLWRGARPFPAFLTGRSMIIAGGMASKLVVYPIAPGEDPARPLTNWAVIAPTGKGGGAPPRPQSWLERGHMEELLPHVEDFRVPHVDAVGLIEGTEEVFEYPMCDRDPLPRWSHGRVTLLGDAAHPMYPVGSNGASQAILDAMALAAQLAVGDDPAAALRRYEEERLPATAAIVRANRTGGPEGVIDAVERLAPDGFDDIEAVLPHAERAAIVQGYAKQAGFAPRGKR